MQRPRMILNRDGYADVLQAPMTKMLLYGPAKQIRMIVGFTEMSKNKNRQRSIQ